MTTEVLGFYRTSIGKKVVMAVTGFLTLGFVIAHMVGNLQIFAGPEAINGYAKFLRSLGPGLWIFRLVILGAALLHIISATQVTLMSLGARKSRYRVMRYLESSYASRTMRWGGPLIGLFVVVHLMHLTFGTLHPDGPAFDASNVYNNVIAGFEIWWVSALYIAVMVFVGLHILHGVRSMFQSMGLNHSKWNCWPARFAVLFAASVTAGNISIPTAVLLGWLEATF